jgi:glycosyltransferase involved in cell wall biosynthesis
MKNIGIITHNFPFKLDDRQNAGIFVSDIAQEMAVKNKITVYCPIGGGRKKRQGKVDIINFFTISGNKLSNLKLWNPVDLIRFISFFVGGIYSLPKFMREGRIKLNLVMWSFPSGVFAYIIKKIYGIPYICWCLGSDIYIYAKKPILKNIIRFILRNSRFIFADGIDLSVEVEKLTGNKCEFVPSVSKAKYKNKSILKVKNKISLVFIGRMETVKGPDILLKALKSIQKDILNFEVHFVGDGTLLNNLKEKAIDYNISDQIIFHGNINNFQEISDILTKADWLVIPSRSDSIPLVFSESMKCGVPIIASDIPDLKYIINKYKVGKLFKRDDFKDLASIIAQLPKLTNDQLFFSKNTKVAVKDFSVEGSVNKIMSFINKI